MSPEKLRIEMNKAKNAAVPFLFALDFEMQEALFIKNPLEQDKILFSVRGLTNAPPASFENKESTLEKKPLSFREYSEHFDIVQKGLKQGDSFLLNLTEKTEIKTPFSLKEIFYRSQALYKLYVPNRFVSFSPERFVKIEGNRISSHPMKGTIDASIENAESIILNDYKERCEHYTIVDLIRNDLNSIASEVEVRRFRYIDKLSTHKGEILQVSSDISGKLSDERLATIADTIFSLLPAGSISGAPKQKTLEIIRKAEGKKRGFYTGIFGYCDGKNIDSAVLIRYIEQENEQFFFRSGGGITINSSCREEYEEMIQKVYLPFK